MKEIEQIQSECQTEIFQTQTKWEQTHENL